MRIPESARVGIDAAATAGTITVDAAATAGTITVDGAQTGNGIDLQWSQPAPTTAHVTLTLGIGLGDIEVTHDQLENRTRIFFVDAAPEVDRYARDFELLTQIAPPQDESAEFIHTIANQLRNNTTSGAL